MTDHDNIWIAGLSHAYRKQVEGEHGPGRWDYRTAAYSLAPTTQQLNQGIQPNYVVAVQRIYHLGPNYNDGRCENIGAPVKLIVPAHEAADVVQYLQLRRHRNEPLFFDPAASAFIRLLDICDSTDATLDCNHDGGWLIPAKFDNYTFGFSIEHRLFKHTFTAKVPYILRDRHIPRWFQIWAMGDLVEKWLPGLDNDPAIAEAKQAALEQREARYIQRALESQGADMGRQPHPSSTAVSASRKRNRI